MMERQKLFRDFHRAVQRLNVQDVFAKLSQYQKIGEGQSFRFYAVPSLQFEFAFGVAKEPLKDFELQKKHLQNLSRLTFSWMPPFKFFEIDQDVQRSLILVLPRLTNFHILRDNDAFSKSVHADLASVDLRYDDYVQSAWYKDMQFVIDIWSVR